MRVSLERLIELADEERHCVHEKDSVKISELGVNGKKYLVELRENLLKELVFLEVNKP